MSSEKGGLPYEPEQSMNVLGQRKSLLYRSQLVSYYEWMRTSGKKNKSDQRVPMTDDGATNYLKRLDQLFRFFWDEKGETSVRLTQDEADVFVDLLAEDEFCKQNGDPYASGSKRKFTDALAKYFEWRAQEKGGGKWTPEVNFKDEKYNSPDHFTKDELCQLREGAYDYGSIPNYKSVSPEERKRWKAELAQRLEKPKEEITPEDWNHVNTTWKFVSLILLTQDAGLRPCEVHNASTTWLRLDKRSIAIPVEDSSKERDNWEVAIRDETAEVLERWKQERKANPRYDETDALWLNREGNRYNSKSLNYFLKGLLDEIGFDTTNRKLSWYSMRHGLGTFMTENGDLPTTKEQLRHKSIQTTMKYVHPSLDVRRNALDSI